MNIEQYSFLFYHAKKGKVKTSVIICEVGAIFSMLAQKPVAESGKKSGFKL